MNVDVERVISAMFGLIVLFLILSRAGEFNAIVRAIGGFVTEQTRTLQGVGTGFYRVLPGTEYK
jgi:hypothetical protein